MGKKKAKFYVVWEGRKTGVFNSWAECQMLVQGYSGAQYKSFPSRAAAEAAFAERYADHAGKSAKKSAPVQVSFAYNEADQPQAPSLSVDAACSGNPGIMEYQGVDTESGEVLFHAGPFENATNNIGEFLALVDGLTLLHQRGSSIPIYSDSRTALAWVRKKHANTTLERDPRNDALFDKIEAATAWLEEHSWDNLLLKWDTENWGEIPADFGRK